jgi:hypothetical protein
MKVLPALLIYDSERFMLKLRARGIQYLERGLNQFIVPDRPEEMQTGTPVGISSVPFEIPSFESGGKVMPEEDGSKKRGGPAVPVKGKVIQVVCDLISQTFVQDADRFSCNGDQGVPVISIIECNDFFIEDLAASGHGGGAKKFFPE